MPIRMHKSRDVNIYIKQQFHLRCPISTKMEILGCDHDNGKKIRKDGIAKDASIIYHHHHHYIQE